MLYERFPPHGLCHTVTANSIHVCFHHLVFFIMLHYFNTLMNYLRWRRFWHIIQFTGDRHTCSDTSNLFALNCVSFGQHFSVTQTRVPRYSILPIKFFKTFSEKVKKKKINTWNYRKFPNFLNLNKQGLVSFIDLNFGPFCFLCFLTLLWALPLQNAISNTKPYDMSAVLVQ